MSMFRSALTLAVLMLIAGATAAAQGQVRLQGAGATFPQPLYERLVTKYQEQNPKIQIDYQAIGSGGGIKGITDKTVDFAGSDAPMSKKEIEAAGGAGNLIEFPSCAGGVVPAFNLPGVTELKFTGEVLAEIFLGKITKWDDPKIAAINAGAKLPSTTITPAWRTDGSGTTFVFTSYLATQSEDFKGSIGTGKQVKWPLGQGGKGNPGVAAIVQQTAGALGYIEQNFADANKIAYGLVKNRSGQFVKASAESVAAASEVALDPVTGPMLAADLWNQPGEKVYPIASFTYLIVYKDLNNVKDEEHAKALVEFLMWATHGGQQLAPALGYAPLSAGVQKKIEGMLRGVSYRGKSLQLSSQ
jgi:phosphate transport system substrate-binding protein